MNKRRREEVGEEEDRQQTAKRVKTTVQFLPPCDHDGQDPDRFRLRIANMRSQLRLRQVGPAPLLVSFGPAAVHTYATY